MLPGPYNHIRDGNLARLLQRLAQQRINLLPTLLRSHVVRGLVVFRRYVGGFRETLDVDRLGRFRVGTPEIFVAQRDVLSLLVLVAAHNVLPLNFLTRALVVALVTNG